MSQTSQQAMIIHRGGYETLALGMDYRAEAAVSGLAWVVAVPNIPDLVETASPSLFQELEGWVRPKWTPDVAAARSASGSKARATDITIHPALTAGPYIIHPLEVSGAEAAAALNAWMQESGFEPLPEAQLGYYIERSWTFLVVELGKDKALRRSGGLEPLVLGFESRTAVLPLKLTTHMGRFPVRVYLVTDDPVDDSDLSGVRERGFMVAASENGDFLPSAVPGAGKLRVEVETFAYADAPQGVQGVLDQAGEWTEQDSLELRFLTNPEFGDGVGMSIYWDEEFSIPALAAFSQEPAVEPETEVVQPGTGSVPTPVEEDGGFFGCQTMAAVQPGLVGALLAWLLGACRRRTTLR